MDGRIRAASVAIFLGLMLVYVGVNAHRRYLNARGENGWFAAVEVGGSKIVEVVGGGPAEGALEAGDELLAINGAGGFNHSAAVNEQMRRVAPGESYTMLVRRGGELREVTLRTRPAPLAALLSNFAPRLLTPFIFLLTGCVVFLLKPFDKEAVLLALLLALFPALPNGFFAGSTGLAPALAALLWAARVIAYSLFAAVFTHFFIVFPESKGFSSPILRRFPRLERNLYLLLIFFVPFGVLVASEEADVPARLGPGARVGLGVFFFAGAMLGLGAIVAGLVSLVVNYRLSGEASRRKMRIVVLGSLAAFVPLFVMLVLEAFDLIPYVRPVSRWLDYSLYFLLPLVPLSFAYAIVRHKVIPVSLIIRRGVRYLFVARGSIVLEMLTVGVVMFFLMDWLFSRTALTGRTVGIVSGVVAILVWVAARALHLRVVAPAIDRRFFRRSYNAQQMLSELGQTLRSLPRVEETCALVSTRVQEALQTENVTVFLREEASEDFVAECSTRFVEAERQVVVGRQELRLGRESFVVARFSESEQPLDVDFADPQGWARSLLSEGGAGGESRRRESETLRAAGSALLLPVATKDRLVGVISLGARLGDLPFSGEDTQMLSAVAVQVAFALENARLLERRAEEEGLRRELEMATEVQQRIFPERPPETDSLDLAGSCLPARGVGGDYYDFLLLEGDRVGLAVADVAGKGMSAALLMSIVQASLRSQAQAADGDLSGLVASMNLLLHRSSGSSSYATFFYAQFEARTRRLTYVNAGHNPPLLVRAAPAPGGSTDGETDGAGARVELLQTGGPVIGLFEHFTFEQETIQLDEGDVLVAFTDGVSEALNPEGEEFGEPRLFALAAAHAGLSAGEIHARVSAEVRAFCRDAPQHDDLTLVIAKVK